MSIPKSGIRLYEKESNQAMELTAGRYDIHFAMTSAFQFAAKRVLASDR